MFGIGNEELVLIVLFAFLLFGPDKLPGMGRTIGRALRQFRTAQEGMSKVVQSEIIDPIQNVADTDKGKAAAEAAKEDEDLTEEEVAAAKPAETFAERRARLAREKAQKSGAAVPAEATPASADSDADADVPAEDAPAPEAPAEPERPAPAPTSVAALYGLDDDELEDAGEDAASDDAPAASDADSDADSDSDADAPVAATPAVDSDADSDADVDSDADAPAPAATNDEEDA